MSDTIQRLRLMAFEAGDEDTSNFLHSVADRLESEPRQDDVDTLLFLAEKANLKWAEIAAINVRLIVALREAAPVSPSPEWSLRTLRLMEEAEAISNGQ